MKLDWNRLETGERIILSDRGITLDRAGYSEIKFVIMNGDVPLGLETEYLEETVGVTFPPALEAGEYKVCVRGIVTETNLKKEVKNILFEILLPIYIVGESVDGLFLRQYDEDKLAGITPDDEQVLICADENGNLIKKDVVNGVVESVNLTEKIENIEKELAELTYKAPTVSINLTMKGSLGDVDLTTEDKTRIITGFRHMETNIKNIESFLTFKKGTTVIKQNIMPTDKMGGVVTLETPETVTFDGIETVTFTLSGTSIKHSAFSASQSIKSYYPDFYGASADRPTELSELTKIKSLSGPRTISVSGEPQYIWFCTTGSVGKITSAGFDVPFEQDGTLSYKGGNYKLYRTSEKIVAGTYAYIIS